MTVTKVTAGVAGLVYLLLWVIAANGASGLVAPLLVPAILAVMVAIGVALNRFMGITPHRPKFNDPDHEKEQ